MRKNLAKTFDLAVVVRANHYQFNVKPHHTGSCVKSRMLLWCKAGLGAVRVNRRRITLGPGDFMLFPWAHDVTYYPDPGNPFLVGGVHVIPRHARTKPVAFSVPHNPDQPLFGCSYRKDVSEAVLPNWIMGSFDDHPAIGHLLEYIVAWYQRGHPAETIARRLGQTLLEELSRLGDLPKPDEVKYSSRLKRMIEYVKNHPTEHVSIQQLCRISRCSTATVHRLFVKAFNESPVEWIITHRIQTAARLLSMTNLPISVVGRHVSVDDPYYFSKLFRARMGMTASEYRKRNSLA